jgi:hypothetical protein
MARSGIAPHDSAAGSSRRARQPVTSHGPRTPLNNPGPVEGFQFCGLAMAAGMPP